MFDFSVVIVAGGAGTRMKAAAPKAMLEVAGAPIVVHAAALFAEVPGVSEIIVVLPAEQMAEFAGGKSDVAVADIPFDASPLISALRLHGVSRVVAGGARRQDSVLNGLRACDAALPYVMVHDAARIFVSPHEMESLMRKTRETGAAILAHPVRDSLKIVESELIQSGVDRSRLWAAQTPQGFHRETLIGAHEAHHSRDVTDDASVAALAGVACAVVQAGATNFKITTPEDLELAEALLVLRAARNGDIRQASAVFRKIPGGDTLFDLTPDDTK